MPHNARADSPGGAAPQRLPATITANGVTRYLTAHLHGKIEAEVTESAIRHVLENWIARAICQNRNRTRESYNYWAFLPGKDELMMQVAVSLDDCEIITATLDHRAAIRLAERGRPWFQRRCRELEVRDAS